MIIAIFEGENTPAKMVEKIYGQLSSADMKRAESALLQANPLIANPKLVPKGTRLVVPRIPGLLPKLPAATKNLESLLDVILIATKTLRNDLRKTADEQVTKAQQDLKVLDSEKWPGLEQDVKRVRQATELRLKNAKAMSKRANETVMQVEQGIKKLIGRLH